MTQVFNWQSRTANNAASRMKALGGGQVLFNKRVLSSVKEIDRPVRQRAPIQNG